MNRAIKVRIYPTQKQTAFLTKQFGAVRFIYNKGLSIMRHQYKWHHKSLSAIKHVKPLIAIAKKSRKYDWLKEYDSIALQEACRNLSDSFNHFFKKRSKYPKFKKRAGHQSSYHCMSINFGETWIKIPKLKSTIKARVHRETDGKLKSITVSKSPTGKYFASLLFEENKDITLPSKHIDACNIEGIDVGIENLLNDSSGEKTSNPRFYKRAQRNLKRKQKSLSRKQLGSKSRAKARRLVAKCHERVAHARNDFQHKVSKTLVDENQAIIVETLKVKNMLKNHKLAKHIADAAWGDLISKLAYKSRWYGKHFVKLDQFFASSKTCSSCGYKYPKLSLSDRK